MKYFWESERDKQNKRPRRHVWCKYLLDVKVKILGCRDALWCTVAFIFLHGEVECWKDAFVCDSIQF